MSETPDLPEENNLPEKAGKKFFSALEKLEYSKQKLIEQRDECLAFQVTDKKSAEEADAKRKKLKTQRVELKKKAKEIRKPYNEAADKVSKLEGEYVDIIQVAEKDLEKKVDEFEEKEAKEKKEKAEQEQIRYNKRLEELFRIGVIADGNTFILDDIRINGDLVKGADDDIYEETILKPFKALFDKHEAERLEKERLEQERQALWQRQIAEMERQRAEWAEQQRIWKEQQEEIAKKEQERLAEEKRLKDEADNKVLHARLSQLSGIVWNGSYAFRNIGESKPLITREELINFPDENFEAIKDAYFKELEDEKQRHEAELKRQMEAEREKIRLQMIEEEKQKLELERLRKLEEMAEATDKEKWNAFRERVIELSRDIPEFKNRRFVKAATITKEKLEDIIEINPSQLLR